MSDIKPTRSELIKLKNKIKLAKSGHKLLKKKRDGLIIEFFELMRQAKTLKDDLTNRYNVASEQMKIARTLNFDYEIKSLAMAISKQPEFKIGKKNLVGVVVPRISNKPEMQKNIFERGHGLINSPSIDEAASSYERLVEKILESAEIETAMRKILEEVEKTKRRVNALEFEVIPKMENQVEFIIMRLEEMERESFTRLKRIKAKS